jgi:hypothetical protein
MCRGAASGTKCLTKWTCGGLIPLLALAATPVFAHGQGQDASASVPNQLQRRFLTEAPHAWFQLEQRGKQLQGLTRYKAYKDGKLFSEYEWQFRRLGRQVWVSYQIIRESERPYGTVLLSGRNDHYFFQLMKKDPKATWTVLAVAPLTQADESKLPDAQKVAYQFYSTHVPFWAGIREPITSPHYTIQQMQEARNGHRIALRVEFVYNSPLRSSQGPLRGWVLFDPERFWTISQGEIRHQGETIVTRAQLSYGQLEDGFPVISALEKWIDRPSSALYESYTFSAWERPLPSPEEFRLSQYGLPEPPEVAWPKPTPWWLYISLSGLVMVLLGLVYYAWRRHRRAASA